MEAINVLSDFDTLYQSLYPVAARQPLSTSVPAVSAVPDVTSTGNISTTQIVAGVVLVAVVVVGCYYVYHLQQQAKQRQLLQGAYTTSL